MYDLQTIKRRNNKRARDYIALAKLKAALSSERVCPECHGEGTPGCSVCDSAARPLLETARSARATRTRAKA